jgi:hypothetical protein
MVVALKVGLEKYVLHLVSLLAIVIALHGSQLIMSE